MSIAGLIVQLFQLIQFIVFLRILLTWFPGIDWGKQPFRFLNSITEPILLPFRRLIPPIGGLDLSPMFALIFLEMLEQIALNLTA